MDTPSAPHGRFGIYTGKVHDNRDPEQWGRLRVIVPSLFGDDPLPTWAMMAGQSLGRRRRTGERGRGVGSFRVPDIGAQVLVQFLDGNPELPVWMPGIFVKEDVPSSARSDGSPGTDRYPRRNVLCRGEELEVRELECGDLVIKMDHPHSIDVDTRGGDIKVRTTNGGKLVINGGQDGEDNAVRVRDRIDVGALSVVTGPSGVTAVIWTDQSGVPHTLSATPTTVYGKAVDGSSTVMIGDR